MYLAKKTVRVVLPQPLSLKTHPVGMWDGLECQMAASRVVALSSHLLVSDVVLCIPVFSSHSGEADLEGKGETEELLDQKMAEEPVVRQATTWRLCPDRVYRIAPW